MSRPAGPPDVTVVIPCYNGHRFLEGAVASARAQDWPATEVVVVDDGSDAPETAAVLARLPGDVRVVRQPNRGVAAARNRGFEEAGGRYVIPLDCDDRIDPGFAPRAVAIAAGRDDAFVYPWTATFGEYQAVLRKRWDPLEQPIVNTVPYCMAVPKALWRRVGGYDEAMRRGAEDWDFNIRLALAGATGIGIPEPLLRYRVSAGGLLRSVTHRRYGVVWREMQRKYPELYRAPEVLRRVRAREARSWPAWAMLAFYGAHRVLPGGVFSALFRALVFARGRIRAARPEPIAA